MHRFSPPPSMASHNFIDDRIQHIISTGIHRDGASPEVWGRVAFYCSYLMDPHYKFHHNHWIRNIELDRKRTKLQIWDTAGQERFRTITTDIRNWIQNIEQHASDNVNKVLVGNKADMDESKRVVPTSKGQALVDEYGIQFFETIAKTNLNVERGLLFNR